MTLNQMESVSGSLVKWYSGTSHKTLASFFISLQARAKAREKEKE